MATVETITARRCQPTGGAVGRAADELVDCGAPVPDDDDFKAPVVDAELGADADVLVADVLTEDVSPPVNTPWPLLIVL